MWDFQTKQCVQTMEGHTHNVATVCCHPELPIIMSGSEDGTLKIWQVVAHRKVVATRKGFCALTVSIVP